MAVDTSIPLANPHVSDDILQPFLAPTFDPADYLNATLPSLTTNIPSATHTDRATISTLASTTNTLLTSLSAQSSRLSSLLTQLTDEILRHSTRLAYEVEILSGETSSLSDALLSTLHTDLSILSVPDPDPISRLRTLTHVRARLDAVVSVFGEALEWPIPPAETSMIAVSTGDADDKGRAALARLRGEIETLLAGEDGVAKAAAKVESLRALAGVWAGTAEEKARLRAVEGWAKTVEEEQRRVARVERRTGTPVQRTATPEVGKEGSFGLMSSLRKIRGDIYTE